MAVASFHKWRGPACFGFSDSVEFQKGIFQCQVTLGRSLGEDGMWTSIGMR